MQILVLHVGTSDAQALPGLPDAPPETGWLWVALTPALLQAHQNRLQDWLARVEGAPLLDLHLQDLLNPQLPSQHGETAAYDLLVFRRLTQATPAPSTAAAPASGVLTAATGAPPSDEHEGIHGLQVTLERIDTRPVGFAVFDRVVLSVHPDDCGVRDAFAQRLLQPLPVGSGRHPLGRLPLEPADLMLRLLNPMVDGYLDLRRELTRDMDRWQTTLLSPRAGADDWQPLLRSRLVLHQLDELCESQRAALQDWIEAIKTWRPPETDADRQTRELLLVRSRDVLEHIERVIHHIDRLERSAETAVQLHFSLQSNRTNDSMRTLTALTAVFLPLNLVTGFFGMNFEFLPLIHSSHGLWWALAAMLLMATVLGTVLWRQRGRGRRPR